MRLDIETDGNLMAYLNAFLPFEVFTENIHKRNNDDNNYN